MLNQIKKSVLNTVIRSVLGDGAYTPPSQADLFYPLWWSLEGRVDGAQEYANFNRAAGVSTVEDFESVIHNCLDGEARFWRARRVENFVDGSSEPKEDIIDGWSLTDIGGSSFTGGILVAANNGDRITNFPSINDKVSLGDKVIFSLDLRLIQDTSGNGLQINLYDGSTFTTQTVHPPIGAFERFSVEMTNNEITPAIQCQIRNSTELIVEVEVDNCQIEILRGSQVSASEYVSVGVESAPWHGANVDGVQYFPTDRDGNFLDDMRGCLVEEAATNHIFSDVLNEWNANNADLINSGIKAPFGSYNFATIVANSEISTQRRIARSPNSTIDGDFTLSFIIDRNSDYSNVFLIINPDGLGERWINFNLSTLEIAGTSGEVTGSARELQGNLAIVSAHGTGAVPGTRLCGAGFVNGTGITAIATIGDSGNITAAMLTSKNYTTSFIPAEVEGTTRPAETLNTNRPAILKAAAANNYLIAVASYTVSDGSNNFDNATTMFIPTDSNDNNLRLSNTGTANYNYRKRVAAINTDATVADDFISKRRNHVLRSSSVDGIQHTLNGIDGFNPNTDNIDLTIGDQLLYIGTVDAGVSHLNAGFALLSVIDQT